MGATPVRSHDSLTGAAARAEQLAALDGSPDAGFNAATEALFRHPADRTALIWQSGDERRELSYGELGDHARAMAAVLAAHGVGTGTRVAVLLPKRPELAATLFGAWSLGATVVPLFTAFGPEAIATRVGSSATALIVTETSLLDRLPAERPTVLDVDALPSVPEAAPEPVAHGAADPFICIYTSGTTGAPKGVLVPLVGLATFRAYLDYSVDLRPDDRLWNMADPGWAYGLYCGILGPMVMGQTIRWLQEPFDPVRAAAFARSEGITNLMSAPTAHRALAPHLDGVPIRVASSAGEPLSTDVADAFGAATGAPLYDQYGQSELGMVAGNHHGLAHEVRPGTMGVPLPGFELAVLDVDGTAVVGEPGQLALALDASPLNFFAGYHGGVGADRVNAAGWYLTGDVVEHHADGTFQFASRSDDVILTAGYRVGPSEIEDPLLRHPAVADCAVVGRPDEQRGEIIVACVVPTDPEVDRDQLLIDLRTHIKREVAAHLAPRDVVLVDEIPRTPSGKAQRFKLRA
ncbi:MAG: AMP-binding protein [Acidimicrobiales bacterium]